MDLQKMKDIIAPAFFELETVENETSPRVIHKENVAQCEEMLAKMPNIVHEYLEIEQIAA